MCGLWGYEGAPTKAALIGKTSDRRPVGFSVILFIYTAFGDSLEFRRRHNTYYSTLSAYASMDPVGIVTSSEIVISQWLGTADRELIRRLPNVSPVLLDIESWRTMILEPYNRLGPGVYIVGAKIEDEGVVAVMERRKPMLRVVQPDNDRLGRGRS